MWWVSWVKIWEILSYLFFEFQSDSGGPLATINRDEPILIGVTSWGPKECGSGIIPGVYAKVSSVIPWINEVMASKN